MLNSYFRTALYLNGSKCLENKRLFLCDQLLNASYETLTSGRVTEPLGCHLHELQLWKFRYIWHRIVLVISVEFHVWITSFPMCVRSPLVVMFLFPSNRSRVRQLTLGAKVCTTDCKTSYYCKYRFIALR